MDKQKILLISFGRFELDFFQRLAAAIQSELGIPVETAIDHSDLNNFYDPARRQYDGNKLIKHIHTEYNNDYIKTMGLFRVDLFIPILTYIFGQAIFKGNVGVVSLFRLKNELYGLKASEKLLFERFLKEVIHELGHTFGLTHCVSPVCVMRSSTYIENVDEKKPHFCAKCREKLVIAGTIGSH